MDLHSTDVVYFDQWRHACPCVLMVKNKEKRLKMIKKYFFWGGGVVCFSYTTSPPRSPIGSVQCVPFYTLSSPALRGWPTEWALFSTTNNIINHSSSKINFSCRKYLIPITNYISVMKTISGLHLSLSSYTICLIYIYNKSQLGIWCLCIAK